MPRESEKELKTPMLKKGKPKRHENLGSPDSCLARSYFWRLPALAILCTVDDKVGYFVKCEINFDLQVCVKSL